MFFMSKLSYRPEDRHFIILMTKKRDYKAFEAYNNYFCTFHTDA